MVIKLFNTPLYIGNGSLCDIFKICIISPNIIIHEFSHCIMAKLCGREVTGIIIELTRGYIKCYIDKYNNVDRLVLASGYVGETITLTSIMPILDKIYDSCNSSLIKILCVTINAFIYLNNCEVITCVLEQLYYSNTKIYKTTDFARLKNTSSYITILSSVLTLSYCLFSSAYRFSEKISEKKIYIVSSLIAILIRNHYKDKHLLETILSEKKLKK